ncbi:unnamed protein product [Coccothraustes coccothraustes]
MTSMKAAEAALCAQKFFLHHQLRDLVRASSAATYAGRGALRMRGEFDGSGPPPVGQRRHCRKAGAHAHCLTRLSGLTCSSNAVLQLRNARTRSDSSPCRFPCLRRLSPPLAPARCPGTACEHQAQVPAVAAVSGEDCRELTEPRQGSQVALGSG